MSDAPPPHPRVLKLEVFRRPDGTSYHELRHRLSMKDLKRILLEIAATIDRDGPVVEREIRKAHENN